MQRLVVRLWSLVFLIAIAAAPAVSVHDPMKTDTSIPLQSPNAVHLLGTDLLGRDVFSRVLYGGRTTLLIALIATLTAVNIGGFWGLLAGFVGGATDYLSVILKNALFAVPGLLLSFMLITLLPIDNTLLNTAFAVGASQVAPMMQVARNAALQGRLQPYVEGAYAAGAGRWWVLMRTILPNAFPLLLAYANVIFAYCILNVAALGFLGLIGLPLEWGVLLAEGREIVREAPWVSAAPGVAITLLVYQLQVLSAQLTLEPLNPRG